MKSTQFWTPLGLCGEGHALLPGGSDFGRNPCKTPNRPTVPPRFGGHLPGRAAQSPQHPVEHADVVVDRHLAKTAGRPTRR